MIDRITGQSAAADASFGGKLPEGELSGAHLLSLFATSKANLRENNLNLKVIAYNLAIFPCGISPQSKSLCLSSTRARGGKRALSLFGNNRWSASMSVRANQIALFVDGANLHATARTLGFDIDYKRLLKEFEGRGSLLRALYYTAISEDQEYSSLRPLTDWLSYNGYTVVTKAVKEFTDASGRRKIKGNTDVELAVDAMELAGQIDQMFLFSGDGSFRSLVEAVQRRGVRVTVISTISSHPPMIADELRRQADVFMDLASLQSELCRDPSERPARAGSSSVAIPASRHY